MNKLPASERARILQLLCEGMSIRAVCRVTDASKNTVIKLLNDAGAACALYMDGALREVPCTRVQVDEIWAFCGAKERNATPEQKLAGWGDIWTWTALCADSKLLIICLVGDRDADYAAVFMHDVRSRLANRVQLTSDGLMVYPDAVAQTFGADVDYAQLVKTYGPAPEGTHRYSPPVCTGARKRAISGNPNEAHVSTSFVERQNLTMQMHMRRFTRLTNGFSKKVANHMHAVALHAMYYNFVKVQEGLRMTPAMAAGVTDTLWTVDNIVRVVELYDAKPDKRGPYKKPTKAPAALS